MRLQHHKWTLFSSVVAIAMVSAGCGGSDPSEAVAVPEETIPAEIDIAETSDETSVLETASLPDLPFQEFLRYLYEYDFSGGPGLIGQELGFPPVLLSAGSYDTDAMVTPLRFTLAESTRLLAEAESFLALVDDSSVPLWDVPLLEWVRPHRLVDPTATADGPPAWPSPIEGWDFDAWFAAHPGIDVERVTTTVGGVDALRYDVSFANDTDVGWECGPGTRCVPIMLRYGEGPFDLVSDNLYRLWVVPQGEFSPIVVSAVVDSEAGWVGFGDKVDSIMDSVELGDPAPVSFSERLWEEGLPSIVPAGPVRFPVMGGVSFEMPESYFVRQSRNWSYLEMFEEEFDLFPPNVEVAGAVQTVDGVAIDTAEQLANLMVEKAGATRLGDGEIAGRPAIVVEMAAVQPGIPIFRHLVLPNGLDPEFGAWFTQDYVQLWAVDTAAGVLIVTAEADSADALEVALGLHEAVRTTLTIEP